MPRPTSPQSPPAPGLTRWHFPPTPVMSTYITAIAAGPYFEVTRQHDGIPLGIYCRQSLASYLDADEIFEITRQGFDYYHAAFGVRYPFGKYDQLFVPEYKSGAMENAGCVTFLEDYIFRSRVTDARREARAQTILHEMAHMWFGDLVTMRWWDDLWLNESFASWAEMVSSTEATRWTDGWTGFAQSYKAWAYRQDQLPSTHPIAADIPDIEAVEVNFDGITYAKGASVLKQLVAYVGRDNFLAGVRDYFARHACGNATLADLLTSLERVLRPRPDRVVEVMAADRRGEYPAPGLRAGRRRPLHRVPRAAGRPRPSIRSCARTASRSACTTAPRAGSSPGGGRSSWTSPGRRTDVPALIGEPRPDLVLVNDDDLTYAKIRLDEHSLRTVIAGISDLSDQLAAALCWAAAWDMTRDGEMPARDFLALVQSGAPSIRQLTVLERTLGQAARRRPALRRPGVAARWPGPARGEPPDVAGPGASQARIISSPTPGRWRASPPHPLALASWPGCWTGRPPSTGSPWIPSCAGCCCTGWSAAAWPARPAIDAELDRDSTDAGERHAAACRAAVPSAAAKAAAWARITDGSLPNATFRAVLRGFRDPDQDELLVPYAAAYYDALAGLWQDGASDMAVFFAQAGYPDSDVSQAAIESADAYLASASPPAALRRLLLERRDDVVRALRCRQRDAQAAG